MRAGPHMAQPHQGQQYGAQPLLHQTAAPQRSPALTHTRAALRRGISMRLSRVPSLLFDIEMEAGSEGDGPVHSPVLDSTVERLSGCLQCGSDAEGRLREDVDEAMAWVNVVNNPVEDNQALAQRLGQLGHDVRVRTALGGGEGFSCLRNLRHVFLTVALQGRTYIVDVGFREQFGIAKPTPRYAALLDCLPPVLVVEEGNVAPLVHFLCDEMQAAFQQHATVLPPWRCASSMLSKWLPRRSLDQQAVHPQPHAHPASSAHTRGAAAGATGPLVHAALQQGQQQHQQHQQQHLQGHHHHHTRFQHSHPQPLAQPPQPPQPQLRQGSSSGRMGAPQLAAAALHMLPQQHAQPLAVPPPQQQQQLQPLRAHNGAAVVQCSKPVSCEPRLVMVGGNFTSL